MHASLVGAIQPQGPRRLTPTVLKAKLLGFKVGICPYVLPLRICAAWGGALYARAGLLWENLYRYMFMLGKLQGRELALRNVLQQEEGTCG